MMTSSAEFFLLLKRVITREIRRTLFVGDRLSVRARDQRVPVWRARRRRMPEGPGFLREPPSNCKVTGSSIALPPDEFPLVDQIESSRATLTTLGPACVSARFHSLPPRVIESETRPRALTPDRHAIDCPWLSCPSALFHGHLPGGRSSDYTAVPCIWGNHQISRGQFCVGRHRDRADTAGARVFCLALWACRGVIASLHGAGPYSRPSARLGNPRRRPRRGGLERGASSALKRRHSYRRFGMERPHVALSASTRRTGSSPSAWSSQLLHHLQRCSSICGPCPPCRC